MQSDSALRAKYLAVGKLSFFSYFHEKFKNFRKFTTTIMAMSGSIYLCK